MSFISNDSFKCTLKKTVGVFSVLFAFLLSAQANVVCMCVTTPVTFLEVIDGDSIWVKKVGRKVLVHFSEVDAPEINEPGKTLECPQDQQKARQARDLIQEMLTSAKEVGLIIKEEISEQELRAQVYADGLSVGQEFFWQRTVNVSCLFQPPNGLPGEDGAARWAARGRITKGTGETNAFTRHTIKSWCLNHRISIRSCMSIRLIIRNTKKDVRCRGLKTGDNEK